MGGLNSLMMKTDQTKSAGNNNNNLGEEASDKGMRLILLNTRLNIIEKKMYYYLDSKTDLQKELGDTNSYIAAAMPYNSAVQNDVQQSTAKRKALNESVNGYDFEQFATANTKYHNYSDGTSECDDDVMKKSSRACKGKRYLEFMNSGKIQTPAAKKSKPNTLQSNGLNNYYKSDSSSPSKSEYDVSDHMYAAAAVDYISVKHESGVSIKKEENSSDLNAKQFDANTFDLDEKIQNLPSLSLDKYLSRKRDPKKKKKINSKRSIARTAPGNKTSSTTTTTTTLLTIPFANPKSPQTILEAKERMQMVGSQKRKARKESITRRDILAMDLPSAPTSSADNINQLEIAATVIEGATANNAFAESNKTDDPTSDLFILATIAEVKDNEKDE